MTMREWPYQKGFAAIGLHRPKDAANVGGTLRAAYAYGAQMVAISGARNGCVRHATNTPQAWKHIPTITTDDLRLHIPYDCVPVAVDLVEGAIPLPSFQHPARAYYIFGPEDGTLGKAVLDWCPQRVMVPTRMCMNLAATVNVILYDRVAKAMRSARPVLLAVGSNGHGGGSRDPGGAA
jgi:tRNA(Leu) C34 or U34 (ribose-2'-O)-methylase TrmL